MTTLIPGRGGSDVAGAPPRLVPTPVPALWRLMLFFALTFAATWALFLPFVLGVVRWGSADGQLLQLLGIAAPSLTAFLLTALFAGWDGVRRLWRQGGRWRVGVGWYALVLAGPGLAIGAGQVVAAALGGEARPVSLSVEAVLAAVVVGLLAGLFEEFGWTGFAFPALQARYGFVWAGIAMGMAVALWHVPFFFAPGTSQSSSSFAFFLLQLIPARIAFGWIYNGTGGSVLLAILFHGAWNAWGEFLETGPMVANPAGVTETAFLCAAAVAALLTIRGSARPARVATAAPLAQKA